MLRPRVLRFEVVTPMWLGGSLSGEAARVEERVRAVVAQWRFWYRAIVGAALVGQPHGLEVLRQKENEVFGGVSGDAHASRFCVYAPPARANFGFTQPGSLTDFQLWRYLAYGVWARPAIEADSTFELEILCSDSDWAFLKPIIYVWSVLGGLGARVRRGLGAVRWTNAPEYGLPNRLDVETLAGALRVVARTSGYDSIPTIARGTEPPFPVLHPQFCLVKLCPRSGTPPAATWNQALVAIRRQLHIEPPEQSLTGTWPEALGPGYGFRQRHDSVRPWVARATKGPPCLYSRDHAQASRMRAGLPSERTGSSSPVTLRNAAFGLPIPYLTWNKMVVGVVVPPKKTGSKGKKKPERRRRPSPVHFRVLKDPDGYRVAVLRFRSRFLPPGASIEAGGVRARPGDVWAELDKFVDGCDGDLLAL